MTLKMIALAAALGLATTAYAAPKAAMAPAKTMTYDCTKAGNKNKTACKNVVPVAVAGKPAMAAVPAAMAPAAMAAKPAAKPMNYDCTKAGNKNKTACKNVVVPVKPMAAAPAMAPAKPMVTTTTSAMTRTKVAAAPKTYGANEVTATLKNGKVVHYDCAKAGNKDKKACAGK